METATAILLVSFGTSYPGSKEKTIDRILEKAKKAFPGCKTYQAWTSRALIKAYKRKSGLAIPTIEEAMAAATAGSITSLAVQPTHFMEGLEHEKMVHLVCQHALPPLNVSFGAPLLSAAEDHASVLKAIAREFSWLPKDEALVLMGHGSAGYASPAYAALDKLLKSMGYGNFFLGCMEGIPSLDGIIQQTAQAKIKKIHLSPFLLAAGGHAHKDMAGDREGSWKSRLESAGYEVECHFKGLGEYEEIQNIYIKHLRKAMERR